MITRIRIIALAALACAAIIVSALGGIPQESKSPEPPATARIKAYIQAFNSGDPEQMKAFFEAHFAASALKQTTLEARLARFQGAKLRLQSIAVEKIVVELPLETSILAKAGNGENVLLRASVEKEAPNKLVSIQMALVNDPANIAVPDPKPDEKELVAAVRTFLEEKTKADEFSGVVLIAKDARVLFLEAYGNADRDKNIPNRKDTKFNLGSINKNFTRAAVLQLERQGKLSLDDPIKKFLPDYPNAPAAEKVTVRHLLDMTSGIGDFFGARYDAVPKDNIRTLQDYLPLFADLPLEFEPGAGNRYSNGGYLVLGLIIEKASGMDYYAYVRENIFKPCGMLNTDSYPRDANVPNLARYEKELSRLMLDGSGKVPGMTKTPHVKLYGIKDAKRVGERDPAFAFKVDGMKDIDAAKYLWDKHNVALRFGDLWNMSTKLYDVPTMVRASLVHYNTKREVLAFLKGLKEMAK